MNHERVAGAARPAGTDPDDGRLRRGLVEDLDAGFAELVGRYGDLVYSVARSWTRSGADAEDLAADTLLRAYRALSGYEPSRIAELAVRPWLLTILRNTARNAARDATRRPAPPPPYEPVDEPVDPRSGPAQRAEQADTQRHLGVALAELSEAQRVAVVLRHVVGLSTGEIGQVLGCKEGTAKSHISRGLQRLRALLTERAARPASPRERAMPQGVAPRPVDGTAQRVLASGRRRR